MTRRGPGRAGIWSKAGSADAATYSISDLRMVGREMAVGFLAGGFLAKLVPAGAWNVLFLHGHGFWTSLENAAVGPLVAVLSFVCSIGNVPLAAALWQGGISFGGVVSFVFADLITFPLLLVYRKQYGPRLALRMLAVFWAIMSLSGLVTGYLFQALGWVPSTRPKLIASHAWRLGATTVLDVVALAVLAVLYWLYRHRDRLGGGSGYATDPVCGMQVETAHAPAWLDHQQHREYFCSEHCRERFAQTHALVPAPGVGD